MVFEGRTITVPAPAVTSVLEAALTLVNATVNTLPIEELVNVMPLLQHTRTVADDAVHRLEDFQAKYFSAVPALAAEQNSAGRWLSKMEEDNLSAYLETISLKDPHSSSSNQSSVNNVHKVIDAASSPARTPAVLNVSASRQVPAGNLPRGRSDPIKPPPYTSPPLAEGETHPLNWYVVTKGTQVGIFADWIETNGYVSQVAGAVYKGYRSWDQAQMAYNRAFQNGWLEILSRSTV